MGFCVVPQGLKPALFQECDGRAEACPLQSFEGCGEKVQEVCRGRSFGFAQDDRNCSGAKESRSFALLRMTKIVAEDDEDLCRSGR